MKPLLPALVAICLVIASHAHPENIEEVKELPQGKDLTLEAEASDPQTRKERCTTCGSGQLNLKSPGNVLAALQALPGAEIHTQQSFESCSSDKGCAGLKVKDGSVVERFGNVESFRNAVTSDGANEFQFHPGGALGEGFGANPPFWWMNANSPFKNGGGSFEKFSKSSSSYSSTGGAGAAGAAGGVPFISGSLDISGNPFLNGDFSKVSGGFGASGAGGETGKPGGFQSSSFESSSFSSSSKGDVDISKNPFLNGGIKFGQGGFAAQGGYGSSASQFGAGSTGVGGAGVGATGQGNYGSNQNGQSSFASQSNSFSSQGQGSGVSGGGLNSGAAFGGQFGVSSGATNKYGAAGYTGSSPSPFTASAGGSNVNLIQNTQKQTEFDYEQQQQTQNIDEAFQASGNVHAAHEHSGGELQQTCAGQGYVCVHKAQCNNGVVNTNGAGVLQAKTQKQYCNIRTEICCRMEVSSLSGAGSLQGSLGVGGATYSGSGSQGSQGSNVFASGQAGRGSFNSGSSSTFGAGQSTTSFGAQSGQGQSGVTGQRGQAGQSGQASFGASSFGSSFGSKGTFGQGSQTGQSAFGQGSQGAFAQGSQGQGVGQTTNTGFSATGSFGSTNSVNRGIASGGASGFESGYNANKFASGSGSNTFGAGVGFSTATPANRYNTNSNFNNEVTKSTSQSNFIETDSFSAGSESVGVFRPGASGSGLKPGIPYLPPVDNINQPTIISSTAIPTYTPRPFVTPRPTTPKPIYRPPVTSTAAPGYLPPEQSDSSNQRETIIPGPNYIEGGILLDQNRQPKPRPVPVPAPSEIPAGCAAALKCTPIEYCTAEGVISNSTVVLTRDQESYRVPLTDCKDLESGRIGKCCRDPYYTDPWPTNQLGKWVPGVFGGNDGKYAPDSRGAGNNPRPQVTVRPPVTGNVLLNNFIPAKPTATPFGPNQVTPGFPSVTASSFAQKGQFGIRGQGQFGQGSQGQYSQGSQGQYSQGGQGQFGVASQGGSQLAQGSQFASNTQAFKGQGQITTQDQGQIVNQGQGQYTEQGQGSYSSGGRGQYAVGGQGQLAVQGAGGQGQYSQFSSESQKTFGQGQGVITGQGQGVISGQGQRVTTGQGQGVINGQGFGVSGGFGTGYRQGFGQGVISGQGVGVSQGFGSSIRQGFGQAIVQGEGQASASEDIYRVFLGQYSGNGQCGVLNGQKPYGNRNDQEVDFAEIPWQAMVLLQTNKSLLCGGVITRPDVVITTASCVEGLEAKNVLIKGGEWKLGIDDEPLPFQIVQVKTILRHPFYKTGSLKNDAAILVLSENLRWAKNIYPICLPSASDTLDAYYNGAGECIVTGWGKQVLQAHLAGSIMHSLNVSLINPGECQAKLSSDYPHLLEQYEQESCACGQPLNPVNNICKVDIGSALACTTDNEHYVLRGIYSWDSGCQTGNQLAAFYKFDLEWYEWAIGVIESVRFAKYTIGTKVTTNQYSGQLTSAIKDQYSGAVKGSSQYNGGGQYSGAVKGSSNQYNAGVKGAGSSEAVAGSGAVSGSQGFGFSQFGSKFSSGSQANSGFNAAITAPISNSFSASYSEKKVFQTEPKIITYTTKPEIVTFTTKPEYFTYTTKPKLVTYTTKPQLVTYTTKPQIITYETSGSGTNPQYVAPGVSFNPGFAGIAGAHKHNAQCKCLEGKK